MRKYKKDEEPFLLYLKSKALMTVKDINTIVYTVLFVGVFIYTVFKEGIEYASRYFFIAGFVLFLIYFYAMIIVFIKYGNISRNSWMLYFIVLAILTVISFFVLSLNQISYLTIMSLVVVLITMGVPYLVGLLKK